MPLLTNDRYTSEDYWNLPEGTRAELIDGKFYDMAPPSRIHQRLVSKLTSVIDQYITNHHGNCQVYPAPFRSRGKRILDRKPDKRMGYRISL